MRGGVYAVAFLQAHHAPSGWYNMTVPALPEEAQGTPNTEQKARGVE